MATELTLAPTNGGADMDMVALAATKVFEAMVALRDAYGELHNAAQSDKVRRWCLAEQANFYTDKDLLLYALECGESLQVTR